MRRQPQQLRSKEMVDRLLEATGRVLVERGLEFVTTNHIAEEAGVNIATLYHYFSNKEQLIEALQDRMTDDLMKRLLQQTAVMDTQQRSLRELVELVIYFALGTLRANPVFVEMSRHWSRLSLQRSMVVIEQYLLQLSTSYFLQHFRAYAVPDLHVRLLVLANSTMATVARHLCEESPVVKDQELVEVLADMIVAVLEKGVERQAAESP